MKSFYVASKVKHAEMWKRVARETGIRIVSTWIHEAGEGQTVDYTELSQRCISEISGASAFILYCEPGEVHKGALIESGVALTMGVHVYCVGTCDSLNRVFSAHPLWHESKSVNAAIVDAIVGDA